MSSWPTICSRVLASWGGIVIASSGLVRGTLLFCISLWPVPVSTCAHILSMTHCLAATVEITWLGLGRAKRAGPTSRTLGDWPNMSFGPLVGSTWYFIIQLTQFDGQCWTTSNGVLLGGKSCSCLFAGVCFIRLACNTENNTNKQYSKQHKKCLVISKECN